jgi:hypothetical protein
VNELHRSIHLRGWSFHSRADEAYKCTTLQNTPSMHRQVRVKFQFRVSIVFMCDNFFPSIIRPFYPFFFLSVSGSTRWLPEEDQA